MSAGERFPQSSAAVKQREGKRKKFKETDTTEIENFYARAEMKIFRGGCGKFRSHGDFTFLTNNIQNFS